MGGRSGIELTELTALTAIVTIMSKTGGSHIVSSRALPLLEESLGLGPQYSYALLLDLAAAWKINLPLVSILGFGGERGATALPPDINNVSLTEVGRVVVDAEASRIAPVPVRLINGTMYRGGLRPSFDPAKIIAALRQLLLDARISDREICRIVGTPSFASSCDVRGEFDTLYAGEQIVIRQTGRITRTDVPLAASRDNNDRADARQRLSVKGGLTDVGERSHLLIDRLPDDTLVNDFLNSIEKRSGIPRPGFPRSQPRSGNILPIEDVTDMSDEDTVRIEITLTPGADIDEVSRRIAAMDGMAVDRPAKLPAPLGDMLRSWTVQWMSEDISNSLRVLESAVANDRQS